MRPDTHPLTDRPDPQLTEQPPPPDGTAPYVDARVQVAERLRRMAARFRINAWDLRYADPLAPHALAYLYAQPDRRPRMWQVSAAWQLWLAHPDVRHLPNLLHDLHQQLAPRAAGEGFDIRKELATGHDEHMPWGDQATYMGAAAISLDTDAGTWDQICKTAKSSADVPAVTRVLLTDGTAMICHSRSRAQFNEFTVQSSEPMQHGAIWPMFDWSQTDADVLRRRGPDRDVFRWLGELSDTCSRADNARISALRSTAASHRPRGHR